MKLSVLCKTILAPACVFIFSALTAQLPDHIYKTNIRGVKLFRTGDISSYPIIDLGSNRMLELHFDDLEGNFKNYYYTFQLCNADWTVSDMPTSDYISGFMNNRITTYRSSSLSLTRYMHYQANLPDRNCQPSRSGNYLLKVFLNGDTSKLAFTKRMLVVDNKASVAAQVQQPFNTGLFNTHQKIQVSVTTQPKVNVSNPQDIKVVLLQNNVWPTSRLLLRPNIFRGNYFEYTDEEQTIFPAGKEWRWINLMSLRLMTDRMQRLDLKPDRTDVYVKPDGDLRKQTYIYYRDMNGIYTIENSDDVNPYWQADYANVYFSYFPPGNKPYEGRDVHIFGELTQFDTGDSTKMIFNPEKGAYEKKLLLKQGFYNYSYITVSGKENKYKPPLLDNTEGNYWGTENSYTVLVYYRSFGSRADELIGVARLNSVIQQ